MKKKLQLKFLHLLLLLLTNGVWAQSSKLWPTKFYNQLPIPEAVYGPVYTFNIIDTTHIFNKNQPDTLLLTDTLYNKPINTYCYNRVGSNAMSYLGPTLIWEKGTMMEFNIVNKLPSNEETTVHWHGMNLPSDVDGGPHEMIMNGNPWIVPSTNKAPKFRAIDNVQTGWYHSHIMDFTTEQVAMGLAGMIILQDTINDNLYNVLPHNYGNNDFPVIIQEKLFKFDSIGSGTNKQMFANKMFIHEHIGNGPVTLINGVMNPYLKVPNQQVRLRLLNGSPRKSFQLALSTKLINPSQFRTMKLIATDGGYTGQTYNIDSLLISPGERMEIIADFSFANHGDSVYLVNRVKSIPKGVVTGGGQGFPNFNQNTPGYAFMAFIIDTTIHPQNPIIGIPNNLVNYTVDTSNVFKRRTKVLQQIGGDGGVWKIDSTGMYMGIINDTILVNKKEMWTIKNTTPVAHPFHIHKIQFQVVYLHDSNNNIIASYPNLPNYLLGYKDVALVHPKTSLTFIARFDSFPDVGIDTMNGFMYHCHILTHEDDSMMHQFLVVDSNTYYNVKTGVKNLTAMNSFLLYPNPVEDVLYLKGNIATTANIRIFDIMGRTLKEETYPPFNGTVKIPISDLPRGMVFVLCSTDSQYMTYKVLIK